MNRHHMGRLAAVAASVCTTAAIAALGSASSAFALTCKSPGFANGSSLQSAAMEKVWLAKGSGWETHTACAPAAKITYTKTGSGPGLEEFGNNTGELNPAEDKTAFGNAEGTKDTEGEVLDWFVGTDDPPTAGQLSNAEAAAGSATLTEITIPVAQSPVGADLSLPVGCLILEGSRVDINNTTLPQLWEGTNPASGKDPGGIQATSNYGIGTWGAFFEQLGYTETTENPPTAEKTFFSEGGNTGACSAKIKPQVRSVGSGTSYVFKNYFAQVNFSVWSAYADDLTSWPTSLKVEEDELSTGGGVKQTNETGSKLAANTAANPGSVGYTNPADASANGGFKVTAASTEFGTGTGGKSAKHQILWAQIQDNGKVAAGAEYANPAKEGEEVANCETTKLVPSDKGIPYSYVDSWFGIVATDPNIAKDAGVGDYSICGLTYDLAWHHYRDANLYGETEGTVEKVPGGLAKEIAHTTKDLFEYIIGQGQTDIQSHYYTRFPTGMAGHVKQAVNPGISG